MDAKKVFKLFKVGQKWRLNRTCEEDSIFGIGMKKGESYSLDLIVDSIKRIRRQHEDPGKEVIFGVCKNGKIEGYIVLSTNHLNNSTISEIPNGFAFYVNEDTVRNEYIEQL